MKDNLTNQQFLQELEKRIKEGSIKVDFDSRSQEESNSTTSWLTNKNILLIAMVIVLGLWFYYSQISRKTFGVQTTVKINEA